MTKVRKQQWTAKTLKERIAWLSMEIDRTDDPLIALDLRQERHDLRAMLRQQEGKQR